MQPAIVKRRIDHFRATATRLRSVAIDNPAMPDVAKELLRGAHALDEASMLLESATFVAKLNHDTIVARNA